MNLNNRMSTPNYFSLHLKQNFITKNKLFLKIQKTLFLKGYDSKLHLRWQVRGQHFGCRTDWLWENKIYTKLSKNKLFGKLSEIFWLSKILLFSESEKNISSCFHQRVDFKYSQTIDEFDMHLTLFQRKIYDNDIDIAMGENNIFDNLISWTTFPDLLINLTTLQTF